MRTLSCIILDDEKLSRERLAILLGQVEDLKIWGVEKCPLMAIQKILKKQPDLVFVDVEMPRMTGFDVVRAVKKKNPQQNFVFVTGYNQYAIKAIRAEAFDFLLKPVDIDELKETINRYRKKTQINGICHDKNIEKIILSLTPREMDVIKLIAQHKSANEIAENLNLSKHTIDTHRKNILQKTALHKISELIVFAIGNRLC